MDRKKNRTSVHFSTGLIDNAYAAGIASSSTMIVDPIDAENELSNGGHAPDEKNSV